jgi:hypothetical protein
MNEAVKTELEQMGSTLAGMPKGMPHAVPEGYFAAMEERMTNVATEPALPETMLPYAAPAGYFDTLPEAITAKAMKATNGGAIYFGRLRMAAAAVVLLMAGIGAWVVLQQNTTTPDRLLASVNEREIREYLAVPDAVHGNAEAYVQQAKVEADDIVTYLDETGWELN